MLSFAKVIDNVLYHKHVVNFWIFWGHLFPRGVWKIVSAIFCSLISFASLHQDHLTNLPHRGFTRLLRVLVFLIFEFCWCFVSKGVLINSFCNFVHSNKLCLVTSRSPYKFVPQKDKQVSLVFLPFPNYLFLVDPSGFLFGSPKVALSLRSPRT